MPQYRIREHLGHCLVSSVDGPLRRICPCAHNASTPIGSGPSSRTYHEARARWSRRRPRVARLFGAFCRMSGLSAILDIERTCREVREVPISTKVHRNSQRALLLGIAGDGCMQLFSLPDFKRSTSGTVTGTSISPTNAARLKPDQDRASVMRLSMCLHLP